MKVDENCKTWKIDTNGVRRICTENRWKSSENRAAKSFSSNLSKIDKRSIDSHRPSTNPSEQLHSVSLPWRKSRVSYRQFSLLDISSAWRKAFHWAGRIESSSTGKSFDIALSSIKMAVYSLAIPTQTPRASFLPLIPLYR